MWCFWFPPTRNNVISVCRLLNQNATELTEHHWSLVSDGGLTTDGFSIESCRSMVAVMDVSFHTDWMSVLAVASVTAAAIVVNVVCFLDVFFSGFCVWPLTRLPSERQHRETGLPRVQIPLEQHQEMAGELMSLWPWWQKQMWTLWNKTVVLFVRVVSLCCLFICLFMVSRVFICPMMPMVQVWSVIKSCREHSRLQVRNTDVCVLQ